MTFHERYLNVKVKILEGNTEDMLQMLDHGDVDLIFVVDRHIYNKDYTVISKKRVDTRFVAGKNFELADRKNISIEELVQYPFVLTEKDPCFINTFPRSVRPVF